jgi:hypothetical protein
MADNIQITAGSGTTILTDDCTTGHAQIVKLAIATDGSATLIPADANGLTVKSGTAANLKAEVVGTGTFAAQVTNATAANLKAEVVGTGTFATQSAITAPAAATGGASTMNATSSDGGTALTSTAQAIKGSAGTLTGYFIYNPNAAAVFVQFYNTAQGSVTVGTTAPLFMLTVPPASAANLWMPGGVAFGTAMSWSATSTAGGNGAPTTALDAVAWYV